MDAAEKLLLFADLVTATCLKNLDLACKVLFYLIALHFADSLSRRRRHPLHVLLSVALLLLANCYYLAAVEQRWDPGAGSSSWQFLQLVSKHDSHAPVVIATVLQLLLKTVLFVGLACNIKQTRTF